jgi:hypothetical protein
MTAKPAAYTPADRPEGLPVMTSLRSTWDAICNADPACLASPEVFFGPDSDIAEPDAERTARVASAREICAACPARSLCLAYALRTRPKFGVWAGLDTEAGELDRAVRASRRAA